MMTWLMLDAFHSMDALASHTNFCWKREVSMRQYEVFEGTITSDGPIIFRPRTVVTLKGAYNTLMAQQNGKAFYFFYRDIKDHLRIDVRRKYRRFSFDEYMADPKRCGVCFTRDEDGIARFC